MKRNWEYKKLGEVCTIERGGSPRPIEKFITDDPNGLNWIKIGDAVEGSKYITSTKEKIKPEGLKKTRLVHKGDFILSNSMSFGRPYILDIDGCIHDGWLVIHDENKVFDKIYLYYLLSSPNMYSEFKRLAVGGVVNNLNSQLVRNVSVAIPPLEEQSRIVAKLDLLTGIIDKQNAQFKELDNLAQAIFYDMFGDPIENPKGWAFEKLENVCSNIVDCPHSTPKKVDYKTEYPCIRTSELKGGSISWTSMQYLEKEEYEIRIARLKPVAGDIVFGREGTIGDAVILPEGYNFSLGQRTMLLRANSALMLNHFLHRTLMSEWVKRQIDAVNVSSTVAHLNIKDFRQFNIPLPPLAIQQSFAEKIQSIEKQKETIRASIADTQKLLDYTMDKYFG